jgi:hypothetical protein
MTDGSKEAQMGCKPWIGIKMVRALSVLFAVLVRSNHSIGATNWISTSYTVTMDTAISHVGESFSGSSELSLVHDTQCTLIVSATGGSEELKNAGGSKLTTHYKLTGVTGGDSAWVDSTTFLTHTYIVPGNNTTTNMTLWVQGTAPSNRAPEAGLYTATIIITATF